VNVSLEGKTYPETAFTVDADRVERFRAAVGSNGASVPATFATVAEFSSFPAIVGDPELALDFSRVVHSEQEYAFKRALRVGETLRVRSRIAQARARAGQAFLTIETELVDGDGEVVGTSRATMLERGRA
jgi:acyl dehydratase